MTSPFLAGLGQRVRDALRPLASPLTHRTSTRYTARVAAATPAGALMVSLNTLSSGFDRVLPGDRLNLGNILFTGQVVAAGGTITNAPLAAGLPGAVSAGMNVTVTRDTDMPCAGWTEAAETGIAVGVSLVVGSLVFCIPCDTLPTAPAVDSFIVDGAGKPWQVKTVTADTMAAVWRVVAV